MKRLPLKERFLSKVNETDTCWNWTASLFTDGYGKFGVERKNRRAHRVSWQLFCGEIPEGTQVLHKCDNRKCVNPEHLFLGTHQDNMKDMVAKDRNARGERSGMAVLTAEAARKIALLASSGRTREEIAAEFGIRDSTVGRIWEGKAWASATRDLLLQAPNKRNKLNPDTVRFIRLQEGKKTSVELAAELGVNSLTIRDVWNGRCWKWVS